KAQADNDSKRSRGKNGMTRKTFAITTALICSATLIGYVPSVVAAPGDPDHHNRPPACQARPETPPDPSSGPPPELKPTTFTTIGQAYYCILDNYYRGPILDSRSI